MSGKVKVQDLDSSTQEQLMALFKGWNFASFGDTGCIMPTTYAHEADNVLNMAARPDDVWVVTYPRSGTTWTQELVWLVKNNLDYERALKSDLVHRFPYLENSHIIRVDLAGIAPEQRQSFTRPSFEQVANAPSPRFIKSHVPLSLLPANLLDAKVVYVARDPRDVAVSFYHLSRAIFNYVGDFKTYWNLFVKDLVFFSPFFPHLKEAWALRHHKNMLFIFYEDMTKDLSSVIKRVASFFGKKFTNEEIAQLCQHLDINNFRKNRKVNEERLLNAVGTKGETFIRKGKSGTWREHFDEEMSAQAQRWLDENLAGTDLRFPTHA
ncbi:sulfotransferase 1B1-like [Cydia fagiglandana]|uniref:sulfotransferase 1B1-like n=1 Tax=Cydia fagiglandana TaxID=1458189 RepID=UPI002FEE6563